MSATLAPDLVAGLCPEHTRLGLTPSLLEEAMADMLSIAASNGGVLQLGGFGLVDGAILAVAAVGLTLQFGVTNYVNFAYGELLTFAAYVAWELQQPPFALPIWAALILATMATGALTLAIGALVYTPIFNRRPQLLYALAMTFAASLVLSNLWTAIWGTQSQELHASSTGSHVIGPFVLGTSDLYFLGLAVVALGLVHTLLHRTKLGRTMRAVSDNKELAAACGLDIRSVTYASWLISGLLAGLAGVMLAIHSHTFDTTLGDTNIYLVFGAVVIGGIGRPAGAVAGAVIIGLSTQWAVPVIGAALSPTVVFALLVLLMIFRPNGVFGSTGRSQFANA